MSAAEQDDAPKRGRPRDAAADAAILRAFFEVVAEHGYAGATMEAVAERAGVAKTTIYRRWASRDALMIAAHGLLTDENRPPDTGTLRGDLLGIASLLIENLGRPPLSLVAAATIGEMAHNPDLAALFREAVVEQRLAMLAEIFERAARRGEITPGEDWRLISEMLVGAVMFRVVVTGEPVDAQVGATLVVALLRAIAPHIDLTRPSVVDDDLLAE